MTKKNQTLLAISGSLRARSSNTTVLQAAETFVPADIRYSVYEGLGTLPPFNPDEDDERHEANTPVKELRSRLAAAAGVLICTPEYANGVPGVLKNALDWIVSSGEFTNKPVATISVSTFPTGGAVAHASLQLTLKMLGAQLEEAGSLQIPVISKKVNEAGELTDRATLEQLKQVMEHLAGRMQAQLS